MTPSQQIRKAKMTPQVIVTLTETGKLQVSSNVANPFLTIGMLECAKATLAMPQSAQPADEPAIEIAQPEQVPPAPETIITRG